MTFKVISSRSMDTRPGKGEYLEVLLRSPHTIFSTTDAALLWGEGNEPTVSARLNKYARAGKLMRLRRGIYAKDENYNRLELATRIYTPSYISFETVLTRAGTNFQYYGTIFSASYLTRTIEVAGQKIAYIRMKDFVLSNTLGIEHESGIAMATKERAYLDRLYVSKDYHLDNPGALDWDKVFGLLPLYRNKRMEKKAKAAFEAHGRDLAAKHL